jgi:hypothetical protein
MMNEPDNKEQQTVGNADDRGMKSNQPNHFIEYEDDVKGRIPLSFKRMLQKHLQPLNGCTTITKIIIRSKTKDPDSVVLYPDCEGKRPLLKNGERLLVEFPLDAFSEHTEPENMSSRAASALERLNAFAESAKILYKAD